jgi:hypothetical protein
MAIEIVGLHSYKWWIFPVRYVSSFTRKIPWASNLKHGGGMKSAPKSRRLIIMLIKNVFTLSLPFLAGGSPQNIRNLEFRGVQKMFDYI